MVSRAVIKMVDDSLKMQGVQISLLAGEVAEKVERFQEYGFTSHPHPARRPLRCPWGVTARTWW